MMKRNGILASDMNSLLADLSEDQKQTARDKYKNAKEKSYDSDKKVNADFTKEEKEFTDDELDQATYNGKYSGRDKNDDVKPMINKLNNFVKCVNDKLKSKFSGKYYCSYNINKISLLFSVYQVFDWEVSIPGNWETDFYAYVDREKDGNDVTLNKLAEKIESLVSQMNVKYGDILKECVKDLKSSNSEAVESSKVVISSEKKSNNILNKLNRFAEEVNPKLEDNYIIDIGNSPYAFGIWIRQKTSDGKEDRCNFMCKKKSKFGGIEKNFKIFINNLLKEIHYDIKNIGEHNYNVIRDGLEKLKSEYDSEAVESSKGFYAPDFKSDVEYDLDKKYNFDEYDMKVINECVDYVIKNDIATDSSFVTYIANKKKDWNFNKIYDAAQLAKEIYLGKIGKKK